ncbi:hypothetical protein [Methylophaga thalassica]|jgi:hypothetical protein|uniref:hypothetical protein n=1 Tax=Methylophaga aminisulfidivorans TaxID=230105 RepID=UPI0024E1D11C|nr:hypothetical protein [Methylophaga aminisulfidivorans]
MNKSALLFSILSVASVSGCQSLMGPSEEVPLTVQGYEITVSTGKSLASSQAISQVFLPDGYSEVDHFGRKGENDKVQAASIHHQGLSEIVLKESVYLETDLSNKHSESYRKVRFRVGCQELEDTTVCRAKVISAQSASHFLTRNELSDWNETNSLRSIVSPQYQSSIVYQRN